MKKMSLIVLCFALFSFAKKDNIQELNQFIDNWHLSASNANFDNYFEQMDDSFIFLGTAPNERWNKSEFASFSKPYFDKGKAWDFKATNRKWQFSKNKKVAWFDETLDTWMQDCRGSGIVIKVKGRWKLIYYNLTVLIENEKIKKFIELRKS